MVCLKGVKPVGFAHHFVNVGIQVLRVIDLIMKSLIGHVPPDQRRVVAVAHHQPVELFQKGLALKSLGG